MNGRSRPQQKRRQTAIKGGFSRKVEGGMGQWRWICTDCAHFLAGDGICWKERLWASAQVTPRGLQEVQLRK